MALEITDRILTNCLLRLPGAVEAAVWQAVFDVVDDLKRNWLQLDPPAGTAVDAWMTEADWKEHYRLIVDGTVGKMAMEASRPYTNEKTAALHMALYSAALLAVRANRAVDGATFPERVQSTIRIRVPQVRDVEMRQQLFETIYELRRDALDLDAPDPAAQPIAWLTTAQWSEHFRLVIEGTVGRLKSQTGLPWADEAGATMALARYGALMTRVRTDVTPATSDSYFSRVLENVRLRVPQARLAYIERKLFDVVTVLRQDVLQKDQPDPAQPPGAWLTTPEWQEHYKLLVEGTVAGLLPDSPAAAAYGAMLTRVRANAATGPRASAYERVMQALRVEIGPQARDGVLQMELYETVYELRRDVLDLVAPDALNTLATPDQWLTPDQWAEHFRLLIEGTLARLKSQGDMPWFDKEGAALAGARYAAAMARARTDVTPATSATWFARALENVRVRVPDARIPYIERKMFDVLVVLTQDVLQTTQPDPAAAPADWLTEAQWREHYKLIVEGTVAALVPDGPAAASYTTMLQRTRANAATGTAVTAYDRVMQNIRVHVGPAARDGVIQMELYNTIDEVCREALYRDPPANTAAPETWLTDFAYAKYLRLLVSGTLMRLHAQTQPYADPNQVSIHAQTYTREMITARTDATGGPNPSLFTQLYDTVRLQCQGIKDSTINLEYFNAIHEFCERSTAWRRTLQVPLAPDTVLYRLTAPYGAAIRDIVEIGHPTLDTGVHGWFYDKIRGEIAFADGVPRAIDLALPLMVRVILQPHLTASGSATDPETGQPAPTPIAPTAELPADILREHYGPILDGVLMRVFKLPGRPWTNAALAAYHGRRWSNHTGLARDRVRTQVDGTNRLRLRPFARG